MKRCVIGRIAWNHTAYSVAFPFRLFRRSFPSFCNHLKSGATKMNNLVVLLALVVGANAICNDTTFDTTTIPSVYPFSIFGYFPNPPDDPGYPVDPAGCQLATQLINEHVYFKDLLPNTLLNATLRNTLSIQSLALQMTIDSFEDGDQFLIGDALSSTSQMMAIASNVYHLPITSWGATAVSLSDKSQYPYFNRVVPPDNFQSSALLDLCHHFGWRRIGLITTTDEYGLSGGQTIQSEMKTKGFILVTFQQFVPGSTKVQLQVEQIRNALSRVNIAFMTQSDMRTVLIEAYRQEVIGPQWIYICADGCANTGLWLDTPLRPNESQSLRRAARGMLGTVPKGGYGPVFKIFVTEWNKRYFSTYGDYSLYGEYCFDAVLGMAYTLQAALYDPLYQPIDLTGDHLNAIVKNVTYVGATGTVILNAQGDRVSPYDIINIYSTNDDPTLDQFQVIGSWYPPGNPDGNGLVMDLKVEFYDGTHTIPDLDVRKPFDYWSCEYQEEKTDPTGKSAQLNDVDSATVINIASYYICDQYIDCTNISDEWDSCSPSLPIAMIILGIITGLLILSCLLFFAFTITFGWIVPRRVVKASSPLFLLLMIGASVIGYSSIYAWYGKESTAGCIFRLILLSIGLILLLSALFAKTFRIWRLFRRKSFKIKVIKDWQLLVMVVVLSLPVIFIDIFWIAFATPMAKLQKVDGEDHVLCGTGGLIDNNIAGYVLFGILLGYYALILLFGVFLSIMTRKVESAFNESKLIAVSIYNITFLGIVIIPIYFVLLNVSFVAAFVIRTLAILYCFTATLWLQFIPKMWIVFITNRMKEPPSTVSGGMEFSKGNSVSYSDGSSMNSSTSVSASVSD